MRLGLHSAGFDTSLVAWEAGNELEIEVVKMHGECSFRPHGSHHMSEYNAESDRMVMLMVQLHS